MRSLFRPGLFRQLASFLWPERMYYNQKTGEEYLEILLHKNQWQLATENALYSDGRRYAPFRLGFRETPDEFLQQVESCLVLGAGLGSIPQMLHYKYNGNISYTLVDKNEKILSFGTELLSIKKIGPVKPVARDAEKFVSQCNDQFDLICIDVFVNRVVPPAILHEEFIAKVKERLNKPGFLIMNYIWQHEAEWLEFERIMKRNFKQVRVIRKSENRILICNNNE